MYQILQYPKFVWESKNQHGVHSPFVYNLVTECFYDKKEYSAYRSIENYRTKLIRDSSKIEIKDLGAGSRLGKSKSRKISGLAKTSGSSQKQSRLLYRLAKYFEPKTILELGASLGISTYSMSLGNPAAEILSFEGSKSLFDFTSGQPEFKGRNVRFFNDSFINGLATLTDENFDLVFLDGDHTKEGTLTYFETLLNRIHNNSIVIIDDIYWSKGMTEAWNLIKSHEKVTVTVDIFFKGLVFFRKEQAKENFKIRL